MSYPNYLNLRAGAKMRLYRLKQEAARINAMPHRKDSPPLTWRDVRYSGFHNAAANCATLSRGMNGVRPVYYAHSKDGEFPREQFVDEIDNYFNHKGWYTDIEPQETARGIVVKLPHEQYLAGYHWSENDERVYFPEIYNCLGSAIRRADSEAEDFAGICRDDSQKHHEAMALESKLESSLERLRECLALRNHSCFSDLREEARRIVENVREWRETLKTEYPDYI